jgi:hypothetical protein
MNPTKGLFSASNRPIKNLGPRFIRLSYLKNKYPSKFSGLLLQEDCKIRNGRGLGPSARGRFLAPTWIVEPPIPRIRRGQERQSIVGMAKLTRVPDPTPLPKCCGGRGVNPGGWRGVAASRRARTHWERFGDRRSQRARRRHDEPMMDPLLVTAADDGEGVLCAGRDTPLLWRAYSTVVRVAASLRSLRHSGVPPESEVVPQRGRAYM